MESRSVRCKRAAPQKGIRGAQIACAAPGAQRPQCAGQAACANLGTRALPLTESCRPESQAGAVGHAHSLCFLSFFCFLFAGSSPSLPLSFSLPCFFLSFLSLSFFSLAWPPGASSATS